MRSLLIRGLTAAFSPTNRARPTPRNGVPARVPPTLPQALQDYVSLEPAGSGWHIRVASSHEFDSSFLSWLDNLDHDGIAYEHVSVPLEALMAHREALVPRTAEAATAPRVREIKEFLQLVYAVGATDVHWYLGREALTTQLRIDGAIFDAVSWSKTHTDGQVILRATIEMAHNRPPEYRASAFQDAQIDGRLIADTDIDNIRLFRGPADPVAYGGEFMKLRLQTPHHGIPPTRIGAQAASKLLGLRRPLRPSERLAASRVRDNRVGNGRDTTVEREHRSRFELACNALKHFDQRQIDIAVRILAGKAGVIATGPTGAGKTTVLHHAMTYLAELDPARHQISLEDPPEKPLPWAVTLAVSPTAPFAELQRHTLRMDLDLAQVGEIRDAATALAFINAVRSGRLTLGTMHMDDPFEIFDRLHSLDFEQLAPRITANHRLIGGILGTRLIPRLCRHCAIPLMSAGTDSLPRYLREDLLTWGPLDRVALEGPGCPECHGKGVTGRIALVEVIATTPALMADIREHSLDDAMKRHRSRPGSDRALLDRAIEHVLAGEIDPFELQKHLSLQRREDVYEIDDVREGK